MKKLIILVWACLILALAAQATDTHINVPDTGSAKARTKSFTRTSDSQTVQMQLFQNSWLELNFGSSSTGAGNQIFDGVSTDTTSAAIALNGTNLSNYLAVTCECSTTTDFVLIPGYRHYNATDKVSVGARIPFDNTFGTITGFTTLESGYRHAGMAVVETLGAKEMLFRLVIVSTAGPVSCWYSRL